MKRQSAFLLCFFWAALASRGSAHAQTGRAELRGADGKTIGSATLSETPRGVLIFIEASGLTPGPHAFHIHEVGQCEPPFQTAGGHFNPGAKKHGLLEAEGAHVGDLTNVYAAGDGMVRAEVLAAGVTLGPGPTSLFDGNGSSIVVHAGPDDYKTDPAGNAGARVACGVIIR